MKTLRADNSKSIIKLCWKAPFAEVDFVSFTTALDAFHKQFRHFLPVKISSNSLSVFHSSRPSDPNLSTIPRRILTFPLIQRTLYKMLTTYAIFCEFEHAHNFPASNMELELAVYSNYILIVIYGFIFICVLKVIYLQVQITFYGNNMTFILHNYKFLHNISGQVLQYIYNISTVTEITSKVNSMHMFL